MTISAEWKPFCVYIRIKSTNIKDDFGVQSFYGFPSQMPRWRERPQSRMWKRLAVLSRGAVRSFKTLSMALVGNMATRKNRNAESYLPLESLNFLQIVLQSWMSCRTSSSRASCCLFSFWKKFNLFFILLVVSSLIQFLNASSRSFSFSISKSCCLCASRNLLSNPRILSRHSVPSSPFFATFCQLCTSVLICTWKMMHAITI